MPAEKILQIILAEPGYVIVFQTIEGIYDRRRTDHTRRIVAWALVENNLGATYIVPLVLSGSTLIPFSYEGKWEIQRNC